MLTLSHIQEVILTQRTTTPTYLVELDWGGTTLYWSTRDTHEVAGTVYVRGEISLRGAQDWLTANINLNPSAANTAIFQSGSWCGATCIISLLPYRKHPLILQPDYVEDDYGFFSDEVGDPIVLLPGKVMSASYNGNSAITLGIRHTASITHPAPKLRVGPPIFNHLPTPGTVFVWAGETYVLESRD